MPWTVKDVDDHISGLTADQKAVWVKVANSVLSKCLEDGGTDKTCAPKAIRQANAVAKGVSESMGVISEAATIKAQIQGFLRAVDALLANRELPEAVKTQVQMMRTSLKKKWADLDIGDDVKSDEEGEPAKPSPVKPAPDGAATEAARLLAEAGEIISDLGSYEEKHGLIQAALDKKYPALNRDRPYDTPYIQDMYDGFIIFSRWENEVRNLFRAAYAIDRTGAEPVVTLGEPVAVKQVYMVATEAGKDVVVTEAVKTEDGKEFPAGDFAYVPDPDKPSTWKLRLTKTPGGDPDSGIVGAACAALGVGFRGQKVEIPDADLPKVKAKVRAAWKKANPDRDTDEMPAVIKEADADVDVGGDFIPLVEKAVRQDGTVPLKVIQPGWGASGYYSKEVLASDGPKVFAKGTKMYWDHPTPAEEAGRPERSLRDLAAEFVSDASYQANGVAGPGLYADAKVFGPYKEAVNELASHIGVSIRAMGKASAGEAEGKKGAIIERIVAAKSVDFVTTPGAGGEILQLFEAARGKVQTGSNLAAVTLDELKRNRPDLVEGLRAEIKAAVYGEKVKIGEAKRLTDEEIKALKESKTSLEAEVKGLKESVLRKEAETLVTAELAAANLPDKARSRLKESLILQIPVTADGKVDEAAYKTKIKEAVDAEVAYLAEALGSGKIKGMGGSGPVDDKAAGKAALRESFKRLHLAQGKSLEEAEKLAALAAEGR